MIKDLKLLNWLIGQWEGIQGSGIYHESWEKNNASEFNGRAYMIVKGEIKDVENLKLQSKDGEIYYTAEVSHNPAPVSFKLTIYRDTSFVFENPEHDFPQKITYEKKDRDSLLAIIEGSKNEKFRSVEFYLKRVN